MSPVLFKVAFGPFLGLLAQPFFGNHGKGLLRGVHKQRFLLSAVLNGVDALADQVAGFACLLPRTSKGDIGVLAQRKQPFAPCQIELQTPMPGTVGPHQKVQTTAIVQLAVNRHAIAQCRLGATHANIAQGINEFLGHGNLLESVPLNVPPRIWAVKKPYGTPKRKKPRIDGAFAWFLSLSETP